MIALGAYLIFAGKLATDNGFRGVQFGPDTVLASPPMEGCQPGLVGRIRWTCDTTIGDQPVTVSYMAEHGYFSSVFIEGEGYTSCHKLKDVLTAAWGLPYQDNPYIESYLWHDKKIIAGLDINSIDYSCTVTIFSVKVNKLVKQADAVAAQGGVGDL